MSASVKFGWKQEAPRRDVVESISIDLTPQLDGRWRWSPEGLFWKQADNGKWEPASKTFWASQLLGIFFPFGIPSPEAKSVKEAMDTVLGYLTGSKPLPDVLTIVNASGLRFLKDDLKAELYAAGRCDTCHLVNPAQLDQLRAVLDSEDFNSDAAKSIKLRATPTPATFE